MCFPLLVKAYRSQCYFSSQIPSDHFCITHTHTFLDWLFMASTCMQTLQYTTPALLGYLGSLGNTWSVCSSPVPIYQWLTRWNRTTHKQFIVQRSSWNQAQTYSLNGFCLKSHLIRFTPSPLPVLFPLLAYHLPKNPSLLVCSWGMNLRSVKNMRCILGKTLVSGK